MKPKRLAIVAAALTLSCCAPLQRLLGRVILLGRGGRPRGPVHPDRDRDRG